jgi:two-component system, chemotaxis family, sensor kinase CheA
MPELDNELLQQLLKTFRAEAEEHLQTLNQSLLGMERAPGKRKHKQLLTNAFRAAHSLKGASRAVSMDDVATLSDAIESVLQKVRDNTLELDADIADAIYAILDATELLLKGETVEIDKLRNQLLSLINDEEQPPEGLSSLEVVSEELALEKNVPDKATIKSEEETPANMAANEETIRVAVSKLDNVMAQVGELLVAKISADQRLTEIKEIRHQLSQWTKTWREMNTVATRIDDDNAHHLTDIFRRHSNHIQSLTQAVNVLDQAISRDAVRLGMVTGGLQDGVRQIRMVPFQTVSLMLERAVRDAAREEGKDVVLNIKGNDVELDKQVLETLKDPLLHLLRNSVGHGLEDSQTRVSAGKPATGNIWLTVQQRGSEVRISIRDDGLGFDVEAIRSSGVDVGQELTNADDIINLAFLPGVTTSKEVTAISGRGVGLDIVRRQLETIQGRIVIDNMPGKGVNIELTVPTSLAMTRGLLIRIGREQYVLPLLAVEKIEDPSDSIVIGGKRMLRLNGTPLPLVSLASVLERPTNGETPVSNPLAVIMGVAEQRVALLVDDVIAEQELAVKPLGNPLQRVRNVSGVALMGNGEPIIILNPGDLIRSTRNVKTADIAIREGVADNINIRILVVDDSITTRTLEKNILEAAGYSVVTATDGLQALKYLDDNEIDVVVSDIQMPQMDGISLTQRIRNSDKFSALPIILVTSIEDRETRQQGMMAGANAYIVKRGFDQAELLATIRQLT